MNINRNNYEEFFLQYVDNELSAREKNAVDVFLTENPDLQEELLMLQQSILIPETVVFTDKENLFKQEAIDSDMQEQLLLMLDNELDKKAKEKLTGLTKKDAAIKKEWEILQQTKLSAEDKIIFEDKAILYKKEGGRVIAMNWRRIAAAAVVIGFGIWGVLSYSNKAGSVKPDTVKENHVKPVTPAVVPGNKIEQQAPDQKISTDNATAVSESQDDKKLKSLLPAKKINTSEVVKKQEPVIVKEIKDVAKQQENKTNNLPKPLENLNNNDGNNSDVAIVTHSNKDNDIVQPTETIPANEFAVQATAYIDNNSTSDDEDNNKNRKNKIGGFFKKIKRVVERKTNMKSSGDNSIRIANMSFAMQ